MNSGISGQHARDGCTFYALDLLDFTLTREVIFEIPLSHSSSIRFDPKPSSRCIHFVVDLGGVTQPSMNFLTSVNDTSESTRQMTHAPQVRGNPVTRTRHAGQAQSFPTKSSSAYLAAGDNCLHDDIFGPYPCLLWGITDDHVRLVLLSFRLLPTSHHPTHCPIVLDFSSHVRSQIPCLFFFCRESSV